MSQENEKETQKKAFTLKTLTKSSVWDVQENDIFRMWEGAEKDAEIKDNVRHYTDIIRSAFMIEEVTSDSPMLKAKYEKQLSQSIKDIIESGFDISTTTLPQDRLHKKGGMYEKKIEDGYDVLEVQKGTWVEAIFAKAKPEAEKLRMKIASLRNMEDDEDSDEDVEIEDNYNKPDEDDVELEGPNDDDITEDNYSTMMDLGSEDPDEEAAGLEDYSEE